MTSELRLPYLGSFLGGPPPACGLAGRHTFIWKRCFLKFVWWWWKGEGSQIFQCPLISWRHWQLERNWATVFIPTWFSPPFWKPVWFSPWAARGRPCIQETTREHNSRHYSDANWKRQYAVYSKTIPTRLQTNGCLITETRIGVQGKTDPKDGNPKYNMLYGVHTLK